MLVIFLAGIAFVQLLLVLGFPYGTAAWGGQHPGVLPTRYRIGSAISFLVFLFIISIVLSKTGIKDIYSESLEDTMMWAVTVFLGLSVLMNAASRSKVERLWAPYAAVMFVLSLIIVL